jgi:hypothetical protein
MLASYKEAGMEQQQLAATQQRQGGPLKPAVLPGPLPKLQELQLQPKLPPKGNTDQLLGYLLGRPATSEYAAGKGSSANAAGGADGLAAAAVNAALLKQPRATTSITTTTSMNTAGSACCPCCGCSTCTCRGLPGQVKDGWLAASPATDSASLPGSCVQFSEVAAAAAAAAAAVPRPASNSHISDQYGSQQQQQQLRKRRSEVLVSVPSDVDHATRLPRLSVDALPPLSAPGSGSISTLQDDSAEGCHGTGASLHSHKQLRQGSTDDAAVTSNKASMQHMVVASSMQQQAASRQQLLEQQLQEQQQQLADMQMMHAQGSKMLLQQQRQQEQQQSVRQALSAQELEEIEVDLELQQLLLVAQMQVSLSPLDGGSSEGADAAAIGGMNAGYGVSGQLQQPQQCWPGRDAAPAYSARPDGRLNQAASQQVGFVAAGQQQLLQQELMMQQMMVVQQQQQQLLAQQQQQQMMLQQQMAWCSSSAAGRASAAATAAAGMGALTGAAVLAKDHHAFSLDAAMQIAQGGLHCGDIVSTYLCHSLNLRCDAKLQLHRELLRVRPGDLRTALRTQLQPCMHASARFWHGQLHVQQGLLGCCAYFCFVLFLP